MDRIDQQLIDLLYQNGRMSHEDLARKVHLSRPAVYERIKKLEMMGVIKGYQAALDWTKLGYPIASYIHVQYDCTKALEFIQKVKEISHPDIVLTEATRISGEYCVCMKVRAVSAQALQDLLDQILLLPGITQYRTNLILSTLVENDLS